MCRKYILLAGLLVCSLSMAAQQYLTDFLLHLTKNPVDDTIKVIAYRALTGSTHIDPVFIIFNLNHSL